MAYVKPNQTKEVKKALETAFPKSEGWEFSVTKEHHSTLKVAIMRAPVDLIEAKEDEYVVSHQYQNFNVYHLDNYKNAEVLKKIKAIANAGNFDKSDSQSDYFHVGFYLDISAGKWNKPFQMTEAAKPAATPAVAVQTEEAKVEEAAPVAAPELSKLAKQIVPLFPNAVQAGGGMMILAQTKIEDQTPATLAVRSEGFLDIYAEGRFVSESSVKFMSLYLKYFAPLATPPVTEETAPIADNAEHICLCNSILKKDGFQLVCGDCGRTFQRTNGNAGGALIQTARPLEAAEVSTEAENAPEAAIAPESAPFSPDFETAEEMEEVAAYFESFSKHHAAENARRFEQQLDASDCALSEMASGANQRLYSAKAAAVRAGCVSDYRILTDLSGNKVNAKQVNTKYGLKWMIADENGNALEWLSIPYSDRQAANLAKKGYKEAFEQRRSWVKLAGGAIYSLSVINFEIPAGEAIQDIEKAKKAIAAKKAAAASAEPSNVIPFNKAA